MNDKFATLINERSKMVTPSNTTGGGNESSEINLTHQYGDRAA
ncbi:hypothetical protein [Vibrio sp. V10_P2A27P122]|nr:hypothetical protein [Vibrio sp. V10_P2A27P122]